MKLSIPMILYLFIIPIFFDNIAPITATISWQGFFTARTAGLSCLMASNSRLTSMKPSIQKHMILLLTILEPSIAVGAMALEELQDLDDDTRDDVNSDVNNQFDDSKEESNSLQNNQPTIDQDAKYTKTNIHIRNFVDRFSSVIASEIIHRFLPVQALFQSQQKGRRNKRRQHKAINQEGMTHDKGKAIININSERRVGAWCPPESSEDNTAGDSQVEIIIDKSVVPCSPESPKRIEGADESCHVDIEEDDDGESILEDVQPGMVVYVFPQGMVHDGEHESDEGTSNSLTMKDNGADVENNGSGSFHAKRCLIEMGQQYDNDEHVIQYTLLQQEQVELGNVDVHHKDFAYQPVILTIEDSSVHDSALRYTGHELDTRIRPENEVVETIPSLPGHQQSAWNDGGRGGGDQQVSFRWWSWVSHIISHQGKSYNLNNEGSAPHSYSYQNQQQLSYQSNIYEEDGKRPFAGGSHGEIWRARRRCPMNNVRRKDNTPGGDNSTNDKICDDGKDLIVKRLKIEYGYAVLEAGLREVYFGELLGREAESSNLFTTYVDHFFREGSQNEKQIELWIVFENAGPSLRSFLYTAVDTPGGFMVFQHSPFWRRLRRGIAGGSRQCKGCAGDESLVVATHALPQERIMQKPDQTKQEGRHESNTGHSSDKTDAPEGRALLREVLRQLITAVAFLHERGIVHRDIKPSNVMCKTTPSTENGAIPRRIESVRCILGDFSSAWDEFSGRNLYDQGPSSKEQTDEYAPPEVLFQGPDWFPFFSKNPYSYDSWSIGVVALEMLLGTPNVFSVDQRTTVLLANRLKKEGANEMDIKRALYLAALSQFCIYVPTESEGKSWPLRRGDPLHDVDVVKNKCTLNDFHSALRARDPLGTGFDQDANTLLHLVWRLLDWDPRHRLSASDALKHPYFNDNGYSDGTGSWNPIFLHTKLFSNDVASGVQNNALEHQTLDPRFDMLSDSAVTEFICPKCGKHFHDHGSCQKHARSRRHAQFCNYDREKLPQCLNAHSMLPTHPFSGYCDIQGRRKTIEDFHTVHLEATHQFYGVFDGHLGNLASKYAASSFYNKIEETLSNVDDNIRSMSSRSTWKEDASSKIERSFEDLHQGIIKAVTSSPGGVMDSSGTTATILYVTELAIIIANVGDSRAIMSKWLTSDTGKQEMTAMQLTIDHIASSEREQIIQRGGFISNNGGIDRVNGSLAVSRSLGDINLAPFLSRTPHVFAMTKGEAHEHCGKTGLNNQQNLPCFIILASDGLWDVLNNQDAVDLAWQVIKENKTGTGYQEAAEVLTQEAYIRGSSDNIGVCVVAVL